jgi:DNA-binding CsgD family transcriptional regulator
MDAVASVVGSMVTPRVQARLAAGASLASVMDELAYGVVIASAQGQLLHANQAARHELARRRTLSVNGDLLRTQHPQDAKVLADSLARAADGKRSLISLQAASGVPLSIVLVPVHSDQTGGASQVGLFFARASVCDPLMLCFFARSHGLTPTEEQVLGVLCHGYSAPEVATQMQVAVSTVRSHVRSLCAKTRSSGVRELVNRLAVLPPVAASLWREPMH